MILGRTDGNYFKNLLSCGLLFIFHGYGASEMFTYQIASNIFVITRKYQKVFSTEKCPHNTCMLIHVVPMIDYNRKSFIYMQPIINRLEC